MGIEPCFYLMCFVQRSYNHVRTATYTVTQNKQVLRGNIKKNCFHKQRFNGYSATELSFPVFQADNRLISVIFTSSMTRCCKVK